jgi:hypothetical protein
MAYELHPCSVSERRLATDALVWRQTEQVARLSMPSFKSAKYHNESVETSNIIGGFLHTINLLCLARNRITL